MSAAALDLADMRMAARTAGLAYDTFRRIWPDWVRTVGFPAPVRNHRPYKWRPQALADWQVRRETENRAALIAAPEVDAPANENLAPAPLAVPPAPSGRRVDRQRAAIQALMGGR